MLYFFIDTFSAPISHFPHPTRIQKFSSTGDFIKQFAGAGFADGKFRRPRGISVESDDYILCVVSLNFRIQKFTSHGEFIRRWGRYEPNDDRNWHLGDPFDIAVDPDDNNYVTDFLHHFVKKFSSTGEFIRQWGSLGGGDGQFRQPSAIATFSENSLLVADVQTPEYKSFQEMVFSLQNGVHTEPNLVSLLDQEV